MRRLIISFLAIIVVVSVCGCITEGGQSTSTAAPTTTLPTTVPATTTPAPSATSPPPTTPAPTAPPSMRPPVECTSSWTQLQNADNRATSSCEIPLGLQFFWGVQVDTIIRYYPIIAEGRCYIPGDRTLHCLDAETGDLLWSYVASSSLIGTPAYYNGRVFLGDNAGVLHCVDAQTGQRVWTRQIDEHPGGFSSLLIVDGKIYVKASMLQAICCIDTETGVPVWEHALSLSPDGGSRIKMAFEGGLLYVPAGDGGVYCMRADTGSIVWHNDSHYLSNCRCCAVIAGDTVCVGTIGFVYGLSGETGEILWEYDLGSPYVPSFSTDGTQVFICIFKGPYEDGHLSADMDTVDLVSLDPETGSLNWEVTIDDALLVQGAPIVTPTLLVFFGRIGPDPRYSSMGKDEQVTYTLFGVDRETQDVVRLYEGMDATGHGVAVVNGRIYFCTHDGHAYCLG